MRTAEFQTYTKDRLILRAIAYGALLLGYYGIIYAAFSIYALFDVYSSYRLSWVDYAAFTIPPIVVLLGILAQVILVNKLEVKSTR